MRTSDLIDLLARDAGPVRGGAALRRLAPVIFGGALVAGLLAWLAFGWIDPNLWGVSAMAPKLGYTLALVAFLAWLTGRLSLPGATVGLPLAAILAPPAFMVAAGAWQLVSTPPEARLIALFGGTALICPWAILLLSLPTFAGLIIALRSLAPTNPVATGFAAGLLAGATGAATYAFTCSEGSILFVAAWYTLGILMAGAAGAALGSRLLRW